MIAKKTLDRVRPDPLRTDPTRTKSQRNALIRDINGRLNWLKKEISKLLIDDDVFGMLQPKIPGFNAAVPVNHSYVSSFRLLGTSHIPTVNTVWQFLTRDQQLQEFVNWLRSEVSIGVLAKSYQLGSLSDDHWLREHVERTYQKGMERAFDTVKYPELQESLDFFEGTKEQFLLQSFNRPVSVEKVKLLAGRAFNELQGVTDQMATQMQRTLTDGFIKGENPRTIARRLRKDVDNIGKKRAEKIARTEIVRVHNEGQLEALEELGVEQVGVSVEWSTSGLGVTGKGYASPCRLCQPLKGSVFKLSEAKGMLPRHPHCLCSWVPAGVGEPSKGQKRSSKALQRAIDRSISAERPKKKKRTLAQQKKMTSWAGSVKTISKKRPKPLV